MDDARAHERLTEVVQLIDRFGDLYDKRWGHLGALMEDPILDSQLKELKDLVRGRTRFAHDVIAGMGEKQLAAKVVEHTNGE